MRIYFLSVLLIFIFGCSSLPEHQMALETYNYKPRDSAPVGTVVPIREELINSLFVQYQEQYKDKRTVSSCNSKEICISVIKALISQRWRLPNSFNNNENIAKFYLRINQEGILTSLVLDSSSGDLGFDFTCKSAITGSAPFPTIANIHESDWDPEESIAIVFGPVK